MVGWIGLDIVLVINYVGVVLVFGCIFYGVFCDWNGGVNGQVGLGKIVFWVGEFDECECV